MRPPPWLLQLYASTLASRAARADADPAAAQRKTLARIMAQYRGTALGRLQAFDRVGGPADFRREVAVSTPEMTRALFESVAADNPPGAVSAGCLAYMAKCSGTSGVRKLVPYPPGLIAAFKAFELAISLRHMRETGHFDLLGGKLLITTGTPALAPAPNGLRLGYGTGIMTDLAPRMANGLIIPSVLTRLIADTPRKLRAIAEESWNQDVRLLTGVPTWVIPEAEAILALAQERGATARCLQELWPTLRGYVWSGCPIGPSLTRLRALLGPTVPFREVYAGTEGPMAFQWDLGEPGLRLALEQAYFEFQRPEESHLAPRIGIADLVAGQTYRLLVTTPGGLGAYRIADLVRCISTAPHRVVFAGREIEEMSLATEQIVVVDLETALCRAAATAGLPQPATFFVCPGAAAKPAYAWHVELAGERHDAMALAAALDAELAAVSPFYGSCRQGDAFIGPPTVRLLVPGTIQAVAEREREFGMGKVPRVFRERASAQWLLEGLEKNSESPTT